MQAFHGTTILSVRDENQVAVGGDGQVSIGDTVMKGNAVKVRKLYQDKVIAGFAGSTADAFTLFEKFEAALEKYHGQLTRAAVELAKEWRSDRALRKLEAMLIVADKTATLLISGNGDVLEPEAGVLAIGSGGRDASQDSVDSIGWAKVKQFHGLQCAGCRMASHMVCQKVKDISLSLKSVYTSETD